VVEHVGEEVRGGQPLALQPALHVGEAEQHGVDRAVEHLDLELLQAEPGRVRRHPHLRYGDAGEPMAPDQPTAMV
jgi:hypothetical protein